MYWRAEAARPAWSEFWATPTRSDQAPKSAISSIPMDSAAGHGEATTRARNHADAADRSDQDRT